MALISGPAAWGAAVLAGVVATIVATEMEAWNPVVIRGVIKFAVARLPESKRERFREEWPAHIDEVPGQMAKLVVAIGFVFAANGLALDDRCDQVLTFVSEVLGNLDQAQSLMSAILNSVEVDKRLGSLAEVASVVSAFRASANEMQSARNQLAGDLATFSVERRPLVANLLSRVLPNNLFFNVYVGRIIESTNRIGEAYDRASGRAEAMSQIIQGELDARSQSTPATDSDATAERT